MRTGIALFRAGALGLFLGAGIFLQLSGELRAHPAFWLGTLLLQGFPALCGLLLLFLGPSRFTSDDRNAFFFTHGAALIAVLWLLLWCFVWLALMGERANPEMLIKHTSYLHLFGVGFSMAGYATGWMTPRMGLRTARFCMTLGWASSYEAWFNLYFRPELTWFWAPALGGLGLVVGAFLIERALRQG